ncbi:MAG: glycosyltransferase family 39 protein, partial [Cyanobium sp.]
SYWLPATPAAAVLVVVATHRPSPSLDRALWASCGCALMLALLTAAAPLWLPLIDDPDLPQLPGRLVASGLFPRAAALMGVAALLPLLLQPCPPPLRLLALQGPWALLVPLVVLPLLQFGDGLRSAPLRQLALQIHTRTPMQQPVVMIGAVKPSLHFYTRRVVAFEGSSPQSLVNLADRLQREPRLQYQGGAAEGPLLLVAAEPIERDPHWRGVLQAPLARRGRYWLWSLDTEALQHLARDLRHRQGFSPDWQRFQPERF